MLCCCADAIVKRAHSLLALYEESGVSRDKLIFRVPATWSAIQAAGLLEKEGVATQAFHIYRCAARFHTITTRPTVELELLRLWTQPLVAQQLTAQQLLGNATKLLHCWPTPC